MYELAVQDSGSGPAVLMLHAFPCNRNMFAQQAAALVDAGFRVLQPDLPGFGDSPAPTAEPSLSIAAQAVFDILDDRALPGAAVVGLSLGGYVAMEMLREQPGRVWSLALVDTKAAADDPVARDLRLDIASRVEAEQSTAALAVMLPKLVGATTLAERPEVVAKVQDFIHSASPAAVAWTQRAMAARPDSIRNLQSFQETATVIYGDEDVLSTPADQQAMIDVLSDPVVTTIPKCGHLSALEAPDTVTRALLDFLRD